MKKSKQILSLLLVLLMVFATSCTQKPADVDSAKGTDDSSIVTPEENKANDEKVDLVVVGGGMAGLSSSILDQSGASRAFCS